jgi:hypothetical protein
MRRERVDRIGVPLDSGEPVVKRAGNRLWWEERELESRRILSLSYPSL